MTQGGSNHPGEQRSSGTGRSERRSDWQDDWQDEERADDFPAAEPITREQAVSMFGERALRPSTMTPGRVVLIQVVVTLLSAAAWAVFGPEAGPYGWSAWFGGMVCFVPSAFFALRLWMARERTSVGGLVVGEAIKVFATVALFVLVVVLYRDLRWVPMLVTFLLALKTYWVALALR
ncbi:ATP synthase subunit I [Cupriavidus sp. AU9028]|nr:ATP synthase subunit I [Cupriavidus sp. AU9028]